MTRRRFLRGAAATGGLLTLGGLNRIPYAFAQNAALPSPAESGIKHIVVLMMENRSFDHMLGWVDGADGRQGTSKRICPFLPLALWGSKYVDIARPISAFFADAAAGTLPEVSFVEPRFLGEEVGLSNDDHPFADIRNGQAFMNQVYAAITTGPAWPNTVFVINYDEWGMCRLRQRPSRPRIRSSAMKTDCWGSARHAS